MANEHSAPSFVPGHRWKIGLNVAASVLALGAVLLMANYLSARHPQRFLWSADARLQLSPVSKEVLSLVTNRLKVIVFFDRTKPLYDMVSDLLREYQQQCPRIELDFVDYERSLGRAKAVQAEYDLSPASDGDRIVFDLAGNRRVVYAKDLSEFDYGAVLKGQEVRRTGFKGEQLFTSAIFSLVNPAPVKVYFLQGHQEHDPTDADDSMGYLKFARVLQESQVTIAKLEPTALLTSEVPEDCSLLVVANPTAPVAPEELGHIDKYLNSGGRLLVLFSFNALRLATGMERLLARWGVEVGQNFAYESAQGKAGDQRQVVISRFGNHPIVNPLSRSRLLLIVPRSIGPRAKAPQSADAPKVTVLASTSEEGIAVRPNGMAERENESIPLMVAVEKGAIQGIGADRGAARIVVTGDSFFLANRPIEEGANRDFARNAVNWLLSRDVLVQGIGTKSLKEYRIIMTTAELTMVRWLFLAGFPGGVLLLGFFVWFRRRT